MTPQAIRDAIRSAYDKEAVHYAKFQSGSFAWLHIEKPGFDSHIKELYDPHTRTLDIGCGSGVVARHLMDNGILAQNIVGIDISKGQLAEAKRLNPDITFLNMSADKLEFAPESFDLIVSNMTFHHLDDQQLRAALGRVHHALTENGVFFFIDTHPEYDESLKASNAQRKWLKIPTPWGSEQFLFNRSLETLIRLTHDTGFSIIIQMTLPVMEEGRRVDPTGYQKYTSRPSRIAVKLQKHKRHS